MARVTIEDCIKKISNPFDLVLYASQRAKELNQGESTDLDKDNDKNTVIALREIAQEKIPLNYLKIELIKSFQKNTSLLEELEEDRSGWIKKHSDYKVGDEDNYDVSCYTIAIEIEQVRRYGKIVYDISKKNIRLD